jgi:nucleoside phosphorylase
VLVVTTFALDWEFAPWRRLRRFRRKDGPVPIYEAQIDSVRLRVVLTGIGRQAATAAAATVFCDRPDLCIASGLAGGLSDTLRVGDVIAPAHVSGPGVVPIACDPSLLALALGCGARRIGALHSASAIVVTATQKRQLSAIADAVDMESRTILGEGRERNVPGLALRAICDVADVDLPLDLNHFVSPQGTMKRSRLLAAMVWPPKALPGFVRLGVLGYRSATALARFLDAYVPRVAGGAALWQPQDAAHGRL